MNLYFVMANRTHTYTPSDYYEPPACCAIYDLVIAKSRSQARYLVWQKHVYGGCYMDMFYDVPFDHIWMLERDTVLTRPQVVTQDKRFNVFWDVVEKKHKWINAHRERCTCEWN
jgi:hypothetical protein